MKSSENAFHCLQPLYCNRMTHPLQADGFVHDWVRALKDIIRANRRLRLLLGSHLSRVGRSASGSLRYFRRRWLFLSSLKRCRVLAVNSWFVAFRQISSFDLVLYSRRKYRICKLLCLETLLNLIQNIFWPLGAGIREFLDNSSISLWLDAWSTQRGHCFRLLGDCPIPCSVWSLKCRAQKCFENEKKNAAKMTLYIRWQSSLHY